MVDDQSHVVDTFALGLATLEDLFESEYFGHLRVLSKFEPESVTPTMGQSSLLGSLDCNDKTGSEYRSYVIGNQSDYPPLPTFTRMRETYLEFGRMHAAPTAVVVVRVTGGDV